MQMEPMNGFYSVWASEEEDDEFMPDAQELHQVDQYLDLSPSSIIAERTRNKLDLVNEPMEKIEAELVGEEPLMLPPREYTPEWANFLNAFHQGNPELVSEDDPKDSEYDFNEDVLNNPLKKGDISLQAEWKIPNREIEDVVEVTDAVVQACTDSTPRKRGSLWQKRKPSDTGFRRILPAQQKRVIQVTLLFSEKQQDTLREQLVQHFQQLMQGFLHGRQGAPQQHPPAVECWKMILELGHLRNKMVSFLTLRHNIEVGLLSPTANVRPKRSVLDMPHLHYLQQVSTLAWPALGPVQSAESPLTRDRAQQIEAMFSKLFKANLRPSDTIPSRRSRFTPAEDRLLGIGLNLHGLRHWAQIRDGLLPHKTVNQLQNRYTTLSSGRNDAHAIANPVMDYLNCMALPFTYQEISLFIRGVQMYGSNFLVIWKRLLPGRPPSVLLQFCKQSQSNTPATVYTPGKRNRTKSSRQLFPPTTLQHPVQVPSPVSIGKRDTVNNASQIEDNTYYYTKRLADLEANIETQRREKLRSQQNNTNTIAGYESESQGFEEDELTDSDDEQIQQVSDVISAPPNDELWAPTPEPMATPSAGDVGGIAAQYTPTINTHSPTVVNTASSPEPSQGVRLVPEPAAMTKPWTKQEDKAILVFSMQKTPTSSAASWLTFQAEKLPDRTVKQIEERYHHLITLYNEQVNNSSASTDSKS